MRWELISTARARAANDTQKDFTPIIRVLFDIPDIIVAWGICIEARIAGDDDPGITDGDGTETAGDTETPAPSDGGIKSCTRRCAMYGFQHMGQILSANHRPKKFPLSGCRILG